MLPPQRKSLFRAHSSGWATKFVQNVSRHITIPTCSSLPASMLRGAQQDAGQDSCCTFERQILDGFLFRSRRESLLFSREPYTCWAVAVDKVVDDLVLLCVPVWAALSCKTVRYRDNRVMRTTVLASFWRLLPLIRCRHGRSRGPRPIV